jgi:hypothetical protein
MAAKKTKAKRTTKPARTEGARPARGSKTAFILSYPMETPSRQIVEEGAAKGLKFGQNYVSAIRTAKRKRDGAPKGKPGRKPNGLSAPKVTASGGSSPEDRLITAILDVGVGRSRQVLAYVVDQLEKMSYPSRG